MTTDLAKLKTLSNEIHISRRIEIRQEGTKSVDGEANTNLSLLAQMADPAVYADAGRVADIGRQQMQLRTELEAAEAELLALYD